VDGGISVHFGLLGMGLLLGMDCGSGTSQAQAVRPYSSTPTVKSCVGGWNGWTYWNGRLISSIYPIDVIKSKIQTDALDPTKRQYKGMMDCIRKTWSKEGWRGFTGGLGPTLIR
jgi:hypothetical protein